MKKLIDRRRKMTIESLLAKDSVFTIIQEFQREGMADAKDVVLVWVDKDDQITYNSSAEAAIALMMLEIAKKIILEVPG